MLIAPPFREILRMRIASRWLVLVAVLGLVVLPPVEVGASSESTHIGAYRVVGDRVVAPNGKQFVPYGFVLSCLAERTFECATRSTPSDPISDVTKIEAAKTYWHANVVRLQVAPQDLLSGGNRLNQAVLADLTKEVSLANRLGMVAIVTDQEEYFNGSPLPTAPALRFWGSVAKLYKADPAVFFDLYNEPRLSLFHTGKKHKASDFWSVWRNGGTVTTASGSRYDFVGMQALVNEIRRDGSHNIVVAEGLNVDKNLRGIPAYALDGGNVAYGMEPDLTPKDDNPKQWAANWGTLSKKVPILMEAFQDWPGSPACDTHSPTLLPELLSYLHRMHLGLIAWTLSPGVLMIGNNPKDPTNYDGTTTQTCDATTGRAKRSSMLENNANGPGAVIRQYFLANSHSVPAPSDFKVTVGSAG